MRKHWYAYTGIAGGEHNPGSYVVITYPINPSYFCPTNGTNLCAIYTSGGQTPDSIASTIEQYIFIAKSRQTPYPTGPNRPYVYVKV